MDEHRLTSIPNRSLQKVAFLRPTALQVALWLQSMTAVGPHALSQGRLDCVVLTKHHSSSRKATSCLNLVV